MSILLRPSLEAGAQASPDHERHGHPAPAASRQTDLAKCLPAHRQAPAAAPILNVQAPNARNGRSRAVITVALPEDLHAELAIKSAVSVRGQATVPGRAHPNRVKRP
jgi:hypothetical protein